MSKLMSVAVAVVLAVTGLVGAPHAPRTPTKPAPVAVRTPVEHHWSETVQAGQVTACGPSSNCSYVIMLKPAPFGHLGAAITAVRYEGVSSVDAPFNLSSVALPANIQNAVKTVMNVTATFTIAGASGHKFELAGCRHTDDGSCDEAQAFAVSKTSGTVQTANITLAANSSRAAWMGFELPVGSSATVSYYTIHVVYYTLD